MPVTSMLILFTEQYPCQESNYAYLIIKERIENQITNYNLLHVFCHLRESEHISTRDFLDFQFSNLNAFSDLEKYLGRSPGLRLDILCLIIMFNES